MNCKLSDDQLTGCYQASGHKSKQLLSCDSQSASSQYKWPIQSLVGFNPSRVIRPNEIEPVHNKTHMVKQHETGPVYQIDTSFRVTRKKIIKSCG